MTILRLRASWTGTGVVGPAISTFYFDVASTGQVAAVGTFFTSIAQLLPNDVTVTVPNTGDVLAETTGSIVAGWQDGATVNVAGTNAGSFQIGAGARIIWDTAGVVNGRHVRGTTFLVPLGGDRFNAVGRLNAADITTMVNAGNALIGSANNSLHVWSRPIPGRAGTTFPAVSSRVPDIPTSLRSRRY